ncbi:PREDICTED: uncharacterized protein LOC105566362 [Vollenhovia emeryi]|uniref:uncharacterized protein LOC105566362 n=1 Tax=Vollenhovia emeryi TaxID=411798 RepID=UPI0005F3B86C|nr:PREDICTED: uncharacterized protein LOC105566362 [Vollenhovia emeryi]
MAGVESRSDASRVSRGRYRLKVGSYFYARRARRAGALVAIVRALVRRREVIRDRGSLQREEREEWREAESRRQRRRKFIIRIALPAGIVNAILFSVDKYDLSVSDPTIFYQHCCPR